MEKKTYKLAYPIQFSGKEVTEISFRLPTGRDIRLIGNSDKSAVDRDHALLMNLTDRPSEFLDSLAAPDYLGLLEAVTPFLQPPKTSKN